MKLNKKVIDSITVCGLCAMLTVTAVTNSGRSEVKAEDKVLANTGLEHTGYNSYAGVAATLFDYEKSLTAENAVTVEKENVEMVATAQDAQQEVQPQLTQEQQPGTFALSARRKVCFYGGVKVSTGRARSGQRVAVGELL